MTDLTKLPIYTTAELHEKLKGVEEVTARMVVVTAVRRGEIDGMPQLVVYHRNHGSGEEYGVILDKHYAGELTRTLGPHPLVEEFFREH